MKKNVQRILATILTVIMMISMLPSNVFAADFDADMFVEPAVEAVSVPAEEQEVESTVEEVPVEADEIAEDISVGDAEAVQGSSEEFETVDAADPAAADEIEETTEAPVVDDKITLKAEGKDYVVTVTYDASALLPDDVKVTAEEIKANAKKYDDYCDQALEAVQQENADVEELSYARLFDIKLVDAAGNVLEPASAVDVQIRLKDVETVEESTQIVHFAGEEEIPEVIEPTVENDTVAFATEGFSVYAVIGTEPTVERLTVNFYGTDEEPIATMYVKKADQEAADDVFNQLVYDPGAGAVEEGYAFYGWSIGDAVYTADEPGSNIDQVRTYIRNLEFSDGDELKIYAMLVKYYTVTYIDPDGKNLGTDTAKVKNDGDEVKYTVNKGYSTDSTHDFEGWHVGSEGLNNIVKPEDVTADTIFPNGTEITITGDVEFSVSAPEGHWLVFDENGEHATYNAPQFVKKNETTTEPDPDKMVRNGYTFGGWYTGKPSAKGEDPTGDPFVFNQELDRNTTIYAKWIKNSTAKYTVIIWLEGLTPNSWDFKEALTFEGNVDESASGAVVSQGSGRDRYARINGTNYNKNTDDAFTGFSYREHTQNVKIAPEGDSVVNVYYVRNTYTLLFRTRNRVLQPGFIIPTYDYYYYDKIENIKYGYDISSHFPIKPVTDNWFLELLGVDDLINSLFRWDANTYYSKPIVYIDTMPPADITFTPNTSTAREKEMYYYAEVLPGQSGSVTFKGKQFNLLKGPLGARYNYFSKDEDFLEIAGYDQFGIDDEWDSQGRVYGRDSLNFYYTRKLEKISFNDGAYYDGNNRRMYNGTALFKTVENIPYGSDVSSYNKGGETYYTPGQKDGFVFEGWYIDQPCTQPYTFNRMPAGTINVYAKWRQIEYRVFLRPNAGTDSTLNWGSNQAMSFRIAYNGEISLPYGTRTGYEFFGWHLDSALTQPVYTEGLKLNETTVNDEYDKSLPENYTDVMDKWGNGASYNKDDEDHENRWWITKKFELFGKWSRITVGANGIGVIYDANGGSGAPEDTLLYQDNTTAIAGSAPTAPSGKVFKHWVVQKWNGTKFVDTDPAVKVLPGQTFNVYADDARITDESGALVTNPVEGGHYIYNVQVKAEYVDVEEETLTHITWYMNDGTTATYRDDQNLKINEHVTIYGLGEGETIPSRDGYKFLGWGKYKEAEGPNDAATTPNFLVYNAADQKYYYEGTAVEKVAADEVTPYDALYAIWENIPHFTIYHSATKEKEVIYFTDVFPEGSTLDLTTAREGIYSGVTEDYLYGGFYHYSEEDGVATKGAAYTLEDGYGYGTEMTPKDGETYWLKEVSKEYLVPMVYVTWNTNPNYNPLNMLRAMWLMTDIDDTSYSDYGVIITGDVERTISWTGKFTGFEVTQKNKDGEQSTETWSVKKIWTATEGGYLGASDISEYATNADYKNKNLVLTAYFVTPDSVKVTGIKRMTYNMGNQTMQGWKSPGIYRLPKEEIASTCEKVTRSLTASGTESVKGTYKAQVASETINYTVTKVDNGKNVAQEVEAGDNTGKITYAGKKNYVFAGWYLDKAYTKAADFSAVTGDMTVYAKYLKASDIALGFTKKSSKSGSVTLKATLKIIGAPDLTDAAVTCDYKGKTSAVKFTGVKTRKSGNTTVSTYTGTVAISNLANKSSFTAAVSYKTPDGTTVSVSDKTCKYASGTVTVK